MKTGKRLMVLALAVMLLAGMVPVTVSADIYDTILDVHIDGTQNYDEINEVLKYVNQYRAEAGVDPVVLDAELTKCAMQRAAELMVHAGHDRPDNSSFSTVIDESIFGTLCGENIAGGQKTAAEVSETWYNSEGHYANMISSAWETIGIGCFYQEDGTRYWVQLFSAGSSGKVSTTTGIKNVYSVPIALTLGNFGIKVSPTDASNTIQLFPNQERKVKVEIGDFLLGHGAEPADEILITSSDPSVVRVDGKTLIGVAPGKCDITVNLYYLNYVVPVVVNETPLPLSYSKNEYDCAAVTWEDPTGMAELYYKNVKDSGWTKDEWGKDGSTWINLESGQTYNAVLRVPSGDGYLDVSETLTISSDRIVITSKHEDVWAANGEKAKVKVEAEGVGLTYTWYVRGPGDDSYFVRSSVTKPTYSVTMSEKVNGRRVYCEIYNGKYVIQTPIVTLRMAASITRQPKDTYVAKGKTAKVTVKAAGEGLTYKWYYKDKGSSKFKLTNAFKGSSYSVTMTAARNGRQVYCVVTDEQGNSVKSDVVTIGIKKPLKITKQPVTDYAKSGEKASVTVKASGNGLKYTWYIKNAGASKYSKSSVTKSTYSVTMNSKVKDRLVYCVVTDQHGNSVKSKTVRLRMAATITTQPKDVTVAKGSKAKVTVKATGDELTYTWYIKNPGASKFTKSSVTKSSYSVTMTSKVNGRQVYCVITDAYGNTVRTETVTLRMK